MQVERREEHRWLERFVGEWTYEMEAVAPGEPTQVDRGTESVRSLEGVWIVCEGHSETPEGGGSATTIMTLGYDPAKAKFVGTFIGSMMTNLWIYEGELEPAGNVLNLYSEGPSFTTEGQMAKYRDTIELKSDDHRVMTSSSQGDDGSWTQFMTAHYRRVK